MKDFNSKRNKICGIIIGVLVLIGLILTVCIKIYQYNLNKKYSFVVDYLNKEYDKDLRITRMYYKNVELVTNPDGTNGCWNGPYHYSFSFENKDGKLYSSDYVGMEDLSYDTLELLTFTKVGLLN